MLRPYFLHHRELLGKLSQAAWQTVQELMAQAACEEAGFRPGMIAVVHTDDGDQQVGVARYVTYPDGRGCEFAIVVGDEWQRRGIATRLLESLIEVARDRRLEMMDGIVLRENRNMLALAERVGFKHERSRDDPELVVLTLRL